jgi:hypothetical protein
MGLLAEMVMRTFYESQGKPVYLVRATRNVEKFEARSSKLETNSKVEIQKPAGIA